MSIPYSLIPSDKAVTPEQLRDMLNPILRRLDEIERDIRLNIKPSDRSLSERLSAIEQDAVTTEESILLSIRELEGRFTPVTTALHSDGESIKNLAERLCELEGRFAPATPPPQKPEDSQRLHPIAKSLHATFCDAIDALNPPSHIHPNASPAFESLPPDVQQAWIAVALQAKSILRQ